jgi:ABC-type uncharacterized transport system substrate-binding protein
MFFTAFTTVVLVGSIDRAWAHPHVWVDAVAELMLDDSHRLTAIRVYWAFDEVYSAIALEELGVPAMKTLRPTNSLSSQRKSSRRRRNFGTSPT